MNNKYKYKGIVIPAVTPLTKDLKLDVAALEKMFNHFREHNAMPFINGTTGESASLSMGLKKEFIKAAGRLKKTGDILYAGISANCLEESVELANVSHDAGVDVVVAALPSYYILSEYQIMKYFEQLAGKTSCPLVIYNIPATTHISIPLQLIDELSLHEKIIGTKDSERNEKRLKESLELWAGRPDFCHFLGWAPKSAEALIGGSDGLIPSSGNLYPQVYDEMYKAVQAGNHDEALRLQRVSDAIGHLYQKNKLLGESLWALKVLMKEMGLCEEYVASPLTPLPEEEERNRLIEAFHQFADHKHSTTKINTNV
ncbi:MAG: dihydrodipicolinate synthase family protein [Mucilaginibacter sp.]